ncbi:hypothetical protein K502DRAFT_36591 [Neoconidiobolus thromboides FSU 785]|nr:hypothetical protein K502DRAFT_36591 [Neoconidiobolus thromboides FSU 785]
MEDLSKKVETIIIDVDEKLNELINQCEASIKKEKYSEAHSILKEALSIDSQNPKIIALTKKLISIKDPSLDESLPKELLLKICNENVEIHEKLEAVQKLEKLSSQPNSVFVNQFNELNGPVLVLETLLNVLKNSQNYKEEFIQYLLKNITNLTQNQSCLESIIKKLALIGDLSLPKLQDETVTLFSGLFRNMFIEISSLKNQDVKNIVKDKLYLLYLNVLFAIGKGYSKNVFKNSILPIIQTFSLYDFPFQFSNHILFKNMMIDNLYSKDEEIRGLTIIILMKAKENKEAFDSISKSLTKKFDDLQSNTSQLQCFVFLKSVFQCIEPLGLELITQESWLLETLDLISFEKEESQIEMVEVLGLACNTTEGRKLIMETSLVYLDQLSKNKGQKMSVLRAQAILVKSKLSIENKIEIDQSTIDDLVMPLIDIIIDKESILSSAAKMTAIESLTFYSIHPKVRAILGNNFLFWAGLTKLGLLEDIHPATLYGISAILSNVLAYRKVLTKEQEQIKKLKKLAKESNQTIDEMQDPNMTDDILSLVKLRSRIYMPV